MTALLLGGPLANACKECGSAVAIPCCDDDGSPRRPHVARLRRAHPEETARPGDVVLIRRYRDTRDRLAVLVEVVAANLVVVRLWGDGLGEPVQMLGLNVVRLAAPGPARDAVVLAASRR